MNPLKAKSSKEKEKRSERFDNAVGEWMARTDADTLNKALDGKSINIRASAKLYATIATNPARLIGSMGMQQGKIKPEHLEVAQALMHLAVNPQRPPTREVIEGHAYNLIMKHIEEEERAKSRRMTRE